MAEFSVRELGKDEYPAWDALITASAQGTIFHTTDWLIRMASLWNQTIVFIGCYEEDQLIGGCPLFLLDPYKAVRIASSTVKSNPYGGVIISDLDKARLRKRESHNNRVILSLLDHIEQKRFDYVNLVNSPGLEDIRPFLQRGWAPKVYYTYILPIDDDIMKNASKDVRQNIRKAQRLGVGTELRFDPEAYWDLMVHTFAKQGLPPDLSKNQLFGLLDLIRKKNFGEMRIASTSSGEIAAAEVTIWDNKMAHSWSAASSAEHLSTGAVSLLCYDIFTDLHHREHTKINLMSGNMAHLSAFNAGFNPQLVPYYGVELSRPKYRLLKWLKP